MKTLDEVVLDHYALGLLDIDDAALAEQAAEMACLPGELAGVMRRLVDAELTARAGKTEPQPEPDPQPQPTRPLEPDRQPKGPTAPWPPLWGPRYTDQGDPMGLCHDRTDEEPAVTVPPSPAAGFRVGAAPGRRVGVRMDGSPLFSGTDTITVQLSACCQALPGDACDCAAWTATAMSAPSIAAPPYDLPWLRAHGLTAVQWDQMQGRAA